MEEKGIWNGSFEDWGKKIKAKEKLGEREAPTEHAVRVPAPWFGFPLWEEREREREAGMRERDREKAPTEEGTVGLEHVDLLWTILMIYHVSFHCPGRQRLNYNVKSHVSHVPYD